ncbi:MetS family NSS transporter small subunit [Bacillus xiapuensis]|nr:MetS family NSS transporter small subunit [Bacillus xiapuensis]
MDGSAVVMMITGVAIIWGGLAASIVHAMMQAKKAE